MRHCNSCDGNAFNYGNSNAICFCRTLDRDKLARAVEYQLGGEAYAVIDGPAWRDFFSNVPVFVDRPVLEEMERVVKALEQAACLPEYRRQAGQWGPSNAFQELGAAGAFMGYDFHLTIAGPRLIEINTNAGGAFLNASLARAQRSCCGATVDLELVMSFDESVASMFASEWVAQRGTGRPLTIAIVDDAPEQQYLYPEFLLATQLLERHGYQTFIADPSELTHGERGLAYRGTPIDLVYNRLVDFDLTMPGHEGLRAAWQTGSAVITPNPAIHALRADKRNLVALSDTSTLRSWGLPADMIQLLEKAVPCTEIVSSGNADELWRRRKGLFFKPVAGHGSKGVYRGSKLTRGAFERLLADEYVAQVYVPPSERLIAVDGQPQPLKVDVRLYTYKGSVLLTAARLYQGQATNFRTAGGGFAPLFIV